eukprot:TRINITY_DN17853_c0_g2_i1.p1 TRINITY_DN17853_c0_g2~~TRINITY_DN17853_c0_g2_i1.p1  ORF type:complete len:489 (-),score=115.72 TRINITY_DN17853_c0_g2_i1:50-1369(-)
MQGVRANFEDSHVLDPEAGIFAVCDGHLGDEAAAFCAERLPAHVLAAGADAAKESLVEAFKACDNELRGAQSEGSEAGSTATLARVRRDGAGSTFTVFVANCGDSRAILWRAADGSIEETRDHRPSDPGEKQRIEAAGGTVCEDFDPPRIDGQLACSRALGAFKYKQDKALGPEAQKVSTVPDLYEWTAKAGDILLIGCDGVFDTLYTKQVVDMVCKPDVNVGEAVAGVLKHCIEKDADDNLTLLAVRLGDVTAVPRSTEMSAGNFLKTKDKEVLEQYETFCLKFGWALKKEMVPKKPPIANLSETSPVPGLRFAHLPPVAKAVESSPAAENKPASAFDGAIEMKVSTKHPASFYIRAAEAFLKGVEARPAAPGREAVAAKAAVDVLQISGTGDAVASAVAAAAHCEANKLARIVKLETAYPELSGHGCPQIRIILQRM